ncbi:ATP-dependent protease subunit HslV [Candidatus Sumerlaeota bacterium]|nr:ATP-dependent protease subunit HslV [Candidatus Sumerlaeota bacterium]
MRAAHPWHEVLAVRKGKSVTLGGDGEVTMQNMVIKQGAKKVRRLYDEKILAGFAGATADALTLFEKLEVKLQSFNGNLKRAAVELAKDWRTDRYLRRLEALLVAADKESMLLLSGNGDVIEPDEGIIAIGSGGGFAYAAAKAYIGRDDFDSRKVVEESLKIAASICIFTNDSFQIETLEV